MPVTIQTSRQPVLASASRIFEAVTRPRDFWIAVAVYLLAHAALRLWASPNIGTDDVQEALAAQSWVWGYGPRNPPLYTWLLMCSYSLFGVGVFAHVVVRYLMLTLLFAAAYACGRRVLRTPGYAELSALSLAALHIVGGSVHAVFTHSVAVAAAVFLTLWALARVVKDKLAHDYAMLGAAVSLGLLSKYSFALFLVPVLIAALMVRETRGAMLAPAMFIVPAVAAILLAPHALWMAQAQFDYAAQVAAASGSDEQGTYLLSVAIGFGDLAETLLFELAPLWIVAAVLFWPLRRRAPRDGATPIQRVVWHTAAIGATATLVFVFTTEATQVKARYLLPLLVLAPLCLFVWLDSHHVEQRKLKLLAASIGATAALVFAVLTVQGLTYSAICRRCWLEMPVRTLAAEIRARGIVPGAIIAAQEHVGGNLRLQFPDATVFVPGFREPEPRAIGSCVLVWNARLDGEAPPLDMLAFAEARLGTHLQGAPQFVNAPMLRSSTRFDRLAYLVVPGASGDCRASSQRSAT